MFIRPEDFRKTGTSDRNYSIGKTLDFGYSTKYIRNEAIGHIRCLCVKMQQKACNFGNQYNYEDLGFHKNLFYT